MHAPSGMGVAGLSLRATSVPGRARSQTQDIAGHRRTRDQTPVVYAWGYGYYYSTFVPRSCHDCRLAPAAWRRPWTAYPDAPVGEVKRAAKV